ncbi:hypothetical protein [Microbacterium sp. SLBN-146]|uniref:hypothetical protein n=1 Tax=Microbacterium sp. SLBN-146 TaxID=2768457 RepID=UPI0011547589|nr:hypothetical protein [Microbacterium sp. SLBN-146]TQJ32201.1 hypothetical protein FBY39_2705 [Microbacterium sp. SLBN-146]
MSTRARTRLAAFVLALTTAAAVPLLGETAAAASADEQVTWGIRPADGPLGTDRPTLALEGAPGSQRSDAVLITNYSERPLLLDVYVTEAGIATDGSATAGAQGDALPGSSVEWVELAADRIEVPIGSAVTLPFTVSPPFDAEPGDHAFALLTSLAGEGDVSVDRRLGIRGYVRVGGELSPGISVSDVSIESDLPADPFAERDGVLSFVVSNEGNVRLQSTAAITLRDLLGRELEWSTTVDDRTDVFVWDGGPLPVLGPGDRVTVVVPLADISAPAVTLTADVLVEAHAFVDPTAVLDPVRASGWMLSVGWPVLVLAAIVVAGLAYLVIRMIRRVRTRTAGAEPSASVPAQEEVSV